MSYEDIRIAGDLTEALEAWLVQRYGKVIDIEVGGVNEGGYAAVEGAHAGEGVVEGVVLLLKHDPKGGAAATSSMTWERTRVRLSTIVIVPIEFWTSSRSPRITSPRIGGSVAGSRRPKTAVRPDFTEPSLK